MSGSIPQAPSSVKTKEKSLFQSNISLDSNFEIKIPLEHIWWFSLAANTIKRLPVLRLVHSQKIQRKHNIYNADSLWIFHFYVAYFSLFLLIYGYLYSVSLKTLPFFKSINFILWLCILFFFFSLSSQIYLYNTMTHF